MNSIHYSCFKEVLVFNKKQGLLIIREAAEVAYGGDFLPLFPNRELLRAQLVVDLIDKYGYPQKAIEVGKLVEIDWEARRGGVRMTTHPQKKQLGEADIIVYTRKRSPFMLINVALPEFYQANLESTVSLLFQMASVLESKEAPVFLVYYTRWYEKGEIQTKYLAIDYRQFKTFESWNKAGRPNENYIPEKYSLQKNINRL